MDSFQEGGRDAPPGQPIPAVTNRIKYVIQMIIDIGARHDIDAGHIRFGLYEDDCSSIVKQMLLFLTRGITSIDKEALEDRLEIEYIPVALDGNGSIQNICPGRGVEFGVAESMGIRAAGPNFVPQSQPIPSMEGEVFPPPPHNCAGLISIPVRGIEYSSNSDLDETSGALPEFDKPKNPAEKHRVIGQIIDNESMCFLERLGNLPVQKKLVVLVHLC